MKRKRYILYKFPSLYGTPRLYRFKFMAKLFTILNPDYIYDFKDIKTGKYITFWCSKELRIRWQYDLLKIHNRR